MFMIAILAIPAGLILWSNYVGFAKSIEEGQRLIASREIVAASITNLAGLPASIRNSLPASTNGALRNCVQGAGCQAGTLNGFILFGPMHSSPQVSGAPGSPLRYDLKGEACIGASPTSCHIQVTTQFRAQCAGGGATCPQAENIEIFYLVEKAPDSSIAAAIKPFSGSTMVKVSSVLTLGD